MANASRKKAYGRRLHQQGPFSTPLPPMPNHFRPQQNFYIVNNFSMDGLGFLPNVYPNPHLTGWPTSPCMPFPNYGPPLQYPPQHVQSSTQVQSPVFEMGIPSPKLQSASRPAGIDFARITQVTQESIEPAVVPGSGHNLIRWPVQDISLWDPATSSIMGLEEVSVTKRSGPTSPDAVQGPVRNTHHSRPVDENRFHNSVNIQGLDGIAQNAAGNPYQDQALPDPGSPIMDNASHNDIGSGHPLGQDGIVQPGAGKVLRGVPDLYHSSANPSALIEPTEGPLTKRRKLAPPPKTRNWTKQQHDLIEVAVRTYPGEDMTVTADRLLTEHGQAGTISNLLFYRTRAAVKAKLSIYGQLLPPTERTRLTRLQTAPVNHPEKLRVVPDMETLRVVPDTETFRGYQKLDPTLRDSTRVEVLRRGTLERQVPKPAPFDEAIIVFRCSDDYPVPEIGLTPRDSMVKHARQIYHDFLLDFNYSVQEETKVFSLAPNHSSRVHYESQAKAFPNSEYWTLKAYIQHIATRSRKLRIFVVGIDGLTTNEKVLVDIYNMYPSEHVEITFQLYHHCVYEPDNALFKNWESSGHARSVYGTYSLESIAETILKRRQDQESAILLTTLAHINDWKSSRSKRHPAFSTHGRNAPSVQNTSKAFHCRLCLSFSLTASCTVMQHFRQHHLLRYRCGGCSVSRTQPGPSMTGCFASQQELDEHEKKCRNHISEASLAANRMG